MNKIISVFLIGSVLSFGSYGYNGSTTSAVTIVGGIIKAQNTEIDHKYKRKDCPVCEGKGWYISGDKITKVNCGYCEPETKANPPKSVLLNNDCSNGKCTIPIKK